MKIANRNSFRVNEKTLHEMANYAPPTLYKSPKRKKSEAGRENTMEDERTLGDTIKLEKKSSKESKARSMSATATQQRKFSRSSSYSSKGAKESPEVQKDNIENQNDINIETLEKLPGTKHKDKYLDKGTFDNSHSLISTLLMKNNDLHELAYRKTYNEIEKDYFKSLEESQKVPPGIKIHYGTSSWIQEYLTEPQNQVEINKKKKLIAIGDQINDGHGITTVNYLPDGKTKAALPGFSGGVQVSDRKKAAIIIQKNIRTFLAVRHYKALKKKLEKFLGTQEKIEVDAEIMDVNWGQFQKTLPKFGKKANQEDEKILTNTFYSVIRPYVNRDDHGDLLILGELADGSQDESEFKTLYKKLYQTEETALHHKYNVLMEKTIKPNYTSDDKSVIKSFLKKNINTITPRDLKIDPFVKPKYDLKKSKPPQPSYEKPAPKRDVSPGKNSERQETSEVYEEDFEVESESNLRNSISENIHGATHDNFASSGKQSMIKESIMIQSVAESRIREDIYESRNSNIKESIKESLEQSSPSRKSKKTEKSIDEDLPLSESINVSEEKSRSVRFKKSGAIEEDIVEESYANEQFESIDESIHIKSAVKSPRTDFGKPSILKKDSKKDTKQAIQFQNKPEIIPESNFRPKEKEVIKEKDAVKEKEATKDKVKNATAEHKAAVFDHPKSKAIYISSEEESYGDDYKEEYRKIKMQDLMSDLPPSKTAEILYTNFQKELEKMLYTDTLAEKITTLENTMDKIYTEKEFNILSSLQRKVTVPQRPITSENQVPQIQPTDEFNPMVHLIKKQNDLERAVIGISNQLKTLIDNFTGTGQARPKKVVDVKRPVVQTRSRSAAPKTEKKEPEKVEIAKESPKIDSGRKSIEEEKRDSRVERPEPVKIEPKAQDNNASGKTSTSPFKLPFNFKKNDGTPFVSSTNTASPEKNEFKLPETKKQEPLKLESQKQDTKKPDLKKKDSMAEEIEEDILVESSGSNKKFEANFSEKEYSESFEELSQGSPKKFSHRDEIKKNKSEHSDSKAIDEDIIDEDIQSIKSSSSDRKPSFQEKKPAFLEKKPVFIAQNLKLPETDKPAPKQEPKKVEPEPVKKVEVKKEEPKKKPEPEEEDYEEIFEELSVHSGSNPSARKKPFNIDDVPEVQSNRYNSPDVVPPELYDSTDMKLKRTQTQSSDIEASLDKSNISWQNMVLTSELERSGSIDLKEKRTDDVIDSMFESLVRELTQPLFPKRNMQEIEKIKAKLQQNKKEEEEAKKEHEHRKVTADIGLPNLMTNSNLSDFDIDKKHERYVKTTLKTIDKVALKLQAADKLQIIGLMMHHLNFNPTGKLDMFEGTKEDQAVLDSFSEIFKNLFGSEVKGLAHLHLTTQELEKKLSSKLPSLIQRTKELLNKRLNINGYDLEQYEMLKRVAKEMTNYCEFHRTSDEANDLYEEEDGLEDLVIENIEKMKEEISDEVMEYLFEETVQELNKIQQRRTK